MGSLGAPEILVILVVALLVLGPDRLPEAARQVGRAINEMRRMSAGFQAEIRDAIQTPAAGPAVPKAPSTGVEPAEPPPSPEQPTPEQQPPEQQPPEQQPQEQKYLWSDLPTSSADGDRT